jgi:hypothetical protein
MEIDEEKLKNIDANFNKFLLLCDKIGARADNAKELVKTLGERLATCPASPNKDYYNCTPGGLIEHSIKFLGNALKLAKAYEMKVSSESLALCCLFANIGKVGDEKEDLYVPTEKSWSVKQGWTYSYNEKIPFLNNQHRSLYLLQKFGIELSFDEYVAILLAGCESEELRLYQFKMPVLAEIIQMANKLTILQEQGKL